MANDASLALFEIQTKLLIDHSIDFVNRRIFINGEITSDTVDLVNQGLTLLTSNGEAKDPVTIVINSPGGSIYDAWAIVALLKSAKVEVNTETIGSCMSSATTVFAAGKRRRASQFTYFLFHQTSVELGNIKQADTKVIYQHFSEEEQTYCSFLADNSNKPTRFWKELIKKPVDIYVQAPKLVKTGLVHEIF